MKFKVTMKDPDTLTDCIADAVKETLEGVDPDEREIIREHRERKYREIAGRWFEYGEYLTVEIDTDARTCVVMPND